MACTPAVLVPATSGNATLTEATTSVATLNPGCGYPLFQPTTDYCDPNVDMFYPILQEGCGFMLYEDGSIVYQEG
jgi:hypothetical protein